MGKLRVFVASPGDVADERVLLASVVNELSRTLRVLVPDVAVELELVKWETHATPGMGRAQELINSQIGDYDIFIGILSRRFGTPTGKAASGTEEEFRLAFDRWQTTGKPQILLYFNVSANSPAKTVSDAEQQLLVAKFRAEIEAKGLVWEYDGAARFADVVRPHLMEVVAVMLAQFRARSSGDMVTVETAQINSRGLMAFAAGTRVRITDIGPKDAYFDRRDRWLGIIGTVISVADHRDDGWLRGELALPEKPTWRFKDSVNFAQVRLESAE